MKIRGKFVVRSHKHFEAHDTYVEIALEAQYANTPEDNSYARATPQGTITMTVTVPTVIETMAIGKVFYVDFTPAE
jgi:hypothetical protein